MHTQNIKPVLNSLLLIAASFAAHSKSAFATVDYEDTISVVSQNVHEETFVVKTLPFLGCAGIPVYCTISMFTFDYKIPQGGCGVEFTQDLSVNSLSCASFEPTVEEVEKGEGQNKYIVEEVTKATLDLSGCKQSLGNSIEDKKLRKQLISTITKAFDQNFPTAKALHIKYDGKSL